MLNIEELKIPFDKSLLNSYIRKSKVKHIMTKETAMCTFRGAPLADYDLVFTRENDKFTLKKVNNATHEFPNSELQFYIVVNGKITAIYKDNQILGTLINLDKSDIKYLNDDEFLNIVDSGICLIQGKKFFIYDGVTKIYKGDKDGDISLLKMNSGIFGWGVIVD